LGGLEGVYSCGRAHYTLSQCTLAVLTTGIVPAPSVPGRVAVVHAGARRLEDGPPHQSYYCHRMMELGAAESGGSLAADRLDPFVRRCAPTSVCALSVWIAVGWKRLTLRAKLGRLSQTKAGKGRVTTVLDTQSWGSLLF
jgi:hypothetical protein